MCLNRDEVVDKMVTWGSWQWLNAGYGETLGFSSDAKCSREHLILGACGGGNKIESFNEMPADVAFVDAKLTQLEVDHKLICKLMFVQPVDSRESIKSRTSFAKGVFIHKYKKNNYNFRMAIESLWSVLGAVLDTPKISENHPYLKKSA